MAIALLFLAVSCRGTDRREYELRGQVLAVDQARQEITIKHEDIPRFMPGMTMPFKVRDAALLQGRASGDLVRATLVVQPPEAYLSTLERTGWAPVTDPVPVRPTTLLEVGDIAPDAAFTDQTGASRRLSDWSPRAIAVTFIYTRCPLPTFCPVMDRHFRQVQGAVQNDERLRGRVQLVSVSFDPAYDRPPVLARHAAAVGADPAMWSFVTGDEAGILPFAQRFGVSVMRDPKAASGALDPSGATAERSEDAAAAEIVHNLRTAVLDGERRVVALFSGADWSPAELVDRLRDAVAVR
jgi:protein SCO1/2